MNLKLLLFLAAALTLHLLANKKQHEYQIDISETGMSIYDGSRFVAICPWDSITQTFIKDNL